MAFSLNQKIGVIGSGIVGRYWAMLFASQGHPVVLYDISDKQLKGAIEFIEQCLKDYEKKGYLKGKISADTQFKLISTTNNLETCVNNCYYIQECVFENVDVKREVFEKLDGVINDETVVGSSASVISLSSFVESFNHRRQFITAHPVNPVYFMPLVEVIPTPWTDPATTTITKDLMSSLGQTPVVQKEVLGGVFNRIQYVVINECWNLIQQGVISAEDMDKVIIDGLGMRYAVVGSLETMRLNAHGLIDYFERYTNGFNNVNSTLLPPPKFTQDQIQKIESELNTLIPLENLEERKKWRDNVIADISLIKRKHVADNK